MDEFLWPARRIELPVIDDLRHEALATLQAARACADGPRPAPLGQ